MIGKNKLVIYKKNPNVHNDPMIQWSEWYNDLNDPMNQMIWMIQWSKWYNDMNDSMT